MAYYIGNHVVLSTEEWKLLQEYISDNITDTREEGIVAYKAQIYANRRRSLREAMNMHFAITPTGFKFEMEGTL